MSNKLLHLSSNITDCCDAQTAVHLSHVQAAGTALLSLAKVQGCLKQQTNPCRIHFNDLKSNTTSPYCKFQAAIRGASEVRTLFHHFCSSLSVRPSVVNLVRTVIGTH